MGPYLYVYQPEPLPAWPSSRGGSGNPDRHQYSRA